LGEDVAINVPDILDDIVVTLVEEQGIDEDVSSLKDGMRISVVRKGVFGCLTEDGGLCIAKGEVETSLKC
jgi:hypothetical protein